MQSADVATTAPPADGVCGSLSITRFPGFNRQHRWTAELVKQWDNNMHSRISPVIDSLFSGFENDGGRLTLLRRSSKSWLGWALSFTLVHPLGLSRQYATQRGIANIILYVHGYWLSSFPQDNSPAWTTE